jgi:hypothetical protein
MTSFQSELLAQAKEILDADGVAHRWEETDSVVTLVLPETNDDGFQVRVEASLAGLVVSAGRMHVHLDEPQSPDQQVQDALGLVRDLLGPGMRLRELRFLGIPYRWYLESEDRGEWVAEHEMGLLIWIPARFASAAIYQNRQLPPRRAV